MPLSSLSVANQKERVMAYTKEKTIKLIKKGNKWWSAKVLGGNGEWYNCTVELDEETDELKEGSTVDITLTDDSIRTKYGTTIKFLHSSKGETVKERKAALESATPEARPALLSSLASSKWPKLRCIAAPRIQSCPKKHLKSFKTTMRAWSKSRH